MKKSILFLTILACANVCISQISRGSMLLGGHASFQSYKGETQMGTSKIRTLNIAPNIGYFFIDKLTIGIRPGLTFSNSDVPSAKLKSTTYMLAPFVRYYFLKSNTKLNVFVDASYGYSQTNYSDPAYFKNYSSNTYEIMGGPCIFLSENVSLEFNVGYKSYKAKHDSNRGNTILTQLGFQIHFNAKTSK